MSTTDPLLAPVTGATHHEVGGVAIDICPAGAGRVKRVIYPAGFRWSKDMKSVSGTDLCMHAHVGFLVRGAIHMQYADGCVAEFTAPQGSARDSFRPRSSRPTPCPSCRWCSTPTGST